jgi:hypothetical protein
MSRPSSILPGTKFGMLTVLFRSETKRRGTYLQFCVCDCGGYKAVVPGYLQNGSTRSCGCLPKIKPGGTCRRTARVESGQRSAFPSEYRIWGGMKSRCLNPNTRGYAYYGARGITVCDRWLESFDAFLEDMGPRPSPAHSIDRVDNDGPYSKTNCRWETQAQQLRHTRRSVYIEYNGERLIVAEWAARLGVTPQLISSRLRARWTTGQVLGFEPPPRHRPGPRDGRRTTAAQRGGRGYLECAAALGISPQAISMRLAQGWPVELALRAPKGTSYRVGDRRRPNSSKGMKRDPYRPRKTKAAQERITAPEPHGDSRSIEDHNRPSRAV